MLSLQLGLFLGFVQQLLDVKGSKSPTCARGWALTHVLHKGQASFGLKPFWANNVCKLFSQVAIAEEGRRAFSHINYTCIYIFKDTQVLTPRKLSSWWENSVLNLRFSKVKVFWTTLHACPYRRAHPLPSEMLEGTPPHLQLSLHKRSFFHSSCVTSASLV